MSEIIKCRECGKEIERNAFADSIGWDVTPLCNDCNDPRDEVTREVLDADDKGWPPSRPKLHKVK